MLEMAERLEANAILDRLVSSGETFDRADAKRLIALIPAKRRRTRLSLIGKVSKSGGNFNGHAAGVGDVNLKEADKEKKASLNELPEHRIGGYVVTHEPGSIEIKLMWADTYEDQSGKACELTYDLKGEPEELQLLQVKTLNLILLKLRYFSYAPWKKPAPAI